MNARTVIGHEAYPRPIGRYLIESFSFMNLI